MGSCTPKFSIIERARINTSYKVSLAGMRIVTTWGDTTKGGRELKIGKILQHRELICGCTQIPRTIICMRRIYRIKSYFYRDSWYKCLVAF